MVEVGGVEFISQLRPHCDAAFHPLIDEVLEQLLTLPTPQTSFSSSATSFEHPETLYIHQSPSVTSTKPSLQNSVKESLGASSQNSSHSDIQASRSSTTLHTSDVGSYMEISKQSFCFKATNDAVYQTSPDSYGGGYSDKSVQVSAWSDSSEGCHDGHTRETGSGVVLVCGRGLLPWRQLTDNDRGILLTTQRYFY